MVGEDNVSKEIAMLMVDNEGEHAGKTSLCRETEGGEIGDE